MSATATSYASTTLRVMYTQTHTTYTTYLQCCVHILADQPRELLAGRHGARHQVEEAPRAALAAAAGVAARLLHQLHVELVPQLLALQALQQQQQLV